MNKDIKILLDAFPKKLENDIKVVFEIIYFNTELCTIDTFDIQIDEETIHIPSRIYCEEPNEIEEIKITHLQRQILNCFFTRHHNGYVRQKRLRQIFTKGSIEKWMIPYILQLAGEYVEEILRDINMNIELIDADDFREFISSNKDFIKITGDRIASYWNEYYKKSIDKDEYAGFKIKEKVNCLNIKTKVKF